MSTPIIPFPNKGPALKLVIIPKPATNKVPSPTVNKPIATKLVINKPSVPTRSSIPSPKSNIIQPTPQPRNTLNLPGIPLGRETNIPPPRSGPIMPKTTIPSPKMTIPSPKMTIPSPARSSSKISSPKVRMNIAKTKVFTPDMIDELTVMDLAKGLNKNDFTSLLDLLANEYYNKEPLISDFRFDELTQLYEEKYGAYDEVGGEPTGEMVELPYDNIESLTKITTEKEVDSYIKNYPGPWIVMDKLDGLTLIEGDINDETKLYTHGRINKLTGKSRGKDVSHLLSYLRIPKPDPEMGIRGECILTTKAFEEIKEEIDPDATSARTTANGAVMAENSFKPEIASKLSYYAFNILTEVSKPEDQIVKLLEMGFEVPGWKIFTKISQQILEDYYLERRAVAGYEMDGLVIYQNRAIPYPEKGRPKHIVAFKTKAGFETAETIVTEVVWQASKQRILSPVIKYETIYFTKGSFDSVTGKNAGFIELHNIGPGTKLIIQLNVVPEIAEIIETDQSGLPDEDVYGAYAWDEKHIRLILLDDNDQVRMRRLKHFIKTLEIKNFGEGRLGALVNAGIDDIEKLLNATSQQLSFLGPNLSVQILDSLREKLNDVSVAKIMDASGFFPGIGETRFEYITEVYPNLLNFAYDPPKEIAARLIQVGGIGNKLADTIAAILGDFVNWMQQQPMIKVKLVDMDVEEEEIQRGNRLQDIRVVFSGFRGDLIKDLSFKTKNESGTVQDNIRKNTNLLVIKDYLPKTLNKKYHDAVAAGIQIMTVDEFQEMYGF